MNEKPKFNIGDIVGTNIKYMEGFGDNHACPQGLRRLFGLKITEVGDAGEAHANEISNGKASRFFYTCISKSGKEYFFNEVFLEENHG